MTARPIEVGWFSALCDDDYELLGVPDPALASTFEHCRDIVVGAEAAGFDLVLLPSGYALGIDNVAFAGGVAPQTRSIELLLAVRCGELVVPQVARQVATLDQMCGGRLKVNIISSDVPGEALGSDERYARTREVMVVLRQLLDGQRVDHDGDHLSLHLDPPRARTVSGRCPPLYFGGLSDAARQVAAEQADVYLLWPDTVAAVGTAVADLRHRAEVAGRSLRFGLRAHVIVRSSEAEARAEAARLVSHLDPQVGEEIRARSLDSTSVGVRRQAELRSSADDDGFVEDHLWTGIGRARSGAGAAIVGDPDQVVATIERYRAVGVDAFILSGYPHEQECRRFGDEVLGRLDHRALVP